MWYECVYVFLHVWTYEYTCIFRPEVDIRYLPHSTLKKKNKSRQGLLVNPEFATFFWSSSDCSLCWLATWDTVLYQHACMTKISVIFFIKNLGVLTFCFTKQGFFKQSSTHHLEWTDPEHLIALPQVFIFFLPSIFLSTHTSYKYWF